MPYFRKNIDEMAAYVPGEQPKDTDRVIKLNTNENPYPPSPKAMAVLGELGPDVFRLYPDPMASSARRALSAVLGVPLAHILPGNGSDDLIMMIARACAGEGGRVVYPVPTFGFYHTQAAVQGAEIVEVPFGEDFALPTDALAEADGAVTFVANPNSPTGTYADSDQLAELARRLRGVLVVDEAYADFARGNALALVERFENVIVLRTMSKGYSLAGLRLAFGIAQPALLAGLMKTKAIYTVSGAADAVGAAAIADQDHKNAGAARIVASRESLARGLGELGFRVWPSEANFLLARPPAGNAGEVHQALARRRILVRHFTQPAIADCLRISIGTDEQNQALLAALREIL